MNEMEQIARNAGYARCPNQETRWYAAAPLIPCYKWPVDVTIENDTIRVTRTWADGKLANDEIASFTNFADYLASCPTVQAYPTGANVWD